MEQLKFREIENGVRFEFIFHLASRGKKRTCIKLDERHYSADGKKRYVWFPSAQVYKFA